VSHGPGAPTALTREPKGDIMLKVLLWVIAIIFVIGLLVVFGIFDLIF
jgi:hypothetical protein